jgi:hypothetical protein
MKAERAASSVYPPLDGEGKTLWNGPSSARFRADFGGDFGSVAPYTPQGPGSE